jgi:C1A family cysteine protease
MWPYDISKFAEKPSDDCYSIAKKYHSVEYKQLEQDLNQFKQCLVQGLPFVFGISVYSSFETEQVRQTGIVPMPHLTTEKRLGGHALMCVGYDDTKQAFIVRNSWGTTWGIEGYCYIPYDYLANVELDLASNFWTIQTITISK